MGAQLTNYSLNKKAKGFVANTDADDDGVGSKWSLEACKRRLAAQLGEARAAAVWRCGGYRTVRSRHL